MLQKDGLAEHLQILKQYKKESIILKIWKKRKKPANWKNIQKKNRLDFDREIAKLKIKFDGIRNMSKLPEAVFIFGLDKDITCAREAKRKGIKIIAIVDTNVNPDIVDYPIPANDDAISSVRYIIDKVKETNYKFKTNTK